MHIKRLLSLIVCVAMLSACVFAQAAENPTSNEIFGEYEMGFTNALEITDIEDTAKLTTDLTKGEFYKMICALGGINPVDSPETIFADLKPGDEYEAYAKALVKAGYISTDSMGNVYASNPISSNEAIALVVSVLGYAPKAKAEGGFPTGYVTVANRLKLTEGLKLGKTLTVGEGIVLIYNSFNVDMMVPKYTVGNKPTEYYVSDDTTILTSTFGAYHYEGIVEGVDITRIAGENDVNPYRMDVSGKIFDIGYIENPYDYLGYEVEIIYITKKGVDPMIVHIAALSSNNVVVLDIEDITEITGTKVTAYAAGSSKKKNYNFEKAVPVVYNGAATEEAFSKALISGKIGTVKLLDNDGNKTADVVFVDAYENFYVGYADLDSFEVYDKFNKANSICLDPEEDDPYVNILSASGDAASFSTIQKGTIVSVYRSLEDAYQGFFNAYVCNDAIVGEIDSVDTNDKTVVIGDAEYEFTAYAFANLESMLKPGITVRLLLDVTGKVAGGEVEADPTFNYGFLIGSDSDENGFSKKLSFRLFNTNNEFIELPAASNIRIDGIKYKNTDSKLIDPVLHAAAVAMYGEEVKDNLEFRASAVRFAVNSNGEVSAIDTLLDGDTMEVATRATETSYRDSLFANYTKETVDCRTYGSGAYITVGPRITLKGTGTAMFVPTPEDIFDDDEYSADVASKSIINDKDYANLWSFYSDKDEARSEFVVIVGSAATGGAPHSSVKLAVVTGHSKMLGEDGEEIDSITVLHDGAEKKIPVAVNCVVSGAANEKDPELAVTMTADQLKKGDVIRYSTNSKDELSSVEFYYRCSTDAKAFIKNAGGYGQQISIRTGYVYETLNEGFLVAYTDNVADLATATYDNLEFVTTAVVTTYVYEYDSEDPTRPEVKNSNTAALKGYTDVGSEASRIVIHQYYGIPYAIVISD